MRRTTTRGITHIKGECQNPEIVAVKYDTHDKFPVLIFEDERQGYKFEIIITGKVRDLLREAAEQ